MKNKIYNFLFLLIFIIIFSIFFSEEYINFHAEKKELSQEKIKLESELNKFNFNKIKSLEDTELFYSPDEKILDLIISEI
jgi:hypothetical protein